MAEMKQGINGMVKRRAESNCVLTIRRVLKSDRIYNHRHHHTYSVVVGDLMGQ